MVMDLERPRLTFDMLQAGTKDGVRLAHDAIKDFFGHENYDAFRKANKKGEDIGAEDRLRVDKEIYGKVQRLVGIQARSGQGLWHQAIGQSNATINYAREILFTDQDRKATMVTDIEGDWDEGRPSTALDRLTTPTTRISEQLKFEQGRQLGLAILCAEIISHDQNGEAKRILEGVQKAMYGPIISGRVGDPTDYRVYSFHQPQTNKLVEGVSRIYPTPQVATDELWVKQLDFPVRRIVVNEGGANFMVPAVYDTREKEVGSAVIKAMRRSLQVSPNTDNSIEAVPYLNDRLGFRLVTVTGRNVLRDKVADNLEKFFGGLEGVENITQIDGVNTEKGAPDRVSFRRMQVSIDGLSTPLEVIVQSLEDYLPYIYEIGNYDPGEGMHGGLAHDLYKLNRVASVAEYLWPAKVYGIDLKSAKITASFEYATRLARKHRIHPSPYPELGM